MIKFDLDKMLFVIPPESHDEREVEKILKAHPEVRFVSLTGVDLGGHSTDEKIPVAAFIADMAKILWDGVQTDGSSVALPGIAALSNARVDILPDKEVTWYVEYNFGNRDYKTGLPVGTLRIPSFLRHNGDRMVGSRIFLRHATKRFRRGLLKLLHENPYVFDYIGGVESADEIEDICLTTATELEFWVKTPDDRADRDQLYTSQELKEQYWKRTIGPVGTALEETLEILDRYGFGVEMGHKEVGGVRAKMGNSGDFDHIMEQLEIDWKYSDPMQAADNEIQVKHVVRDVFRANNLEVTFLAKPMTGVAGNGEHTHLGMTAKLKNGRHVNIYEPVDRQSHFMSPVGFGALMGILRNYEILNPFVAATHDAFQRLKPGFEAPVCIVTSLGQDCQTPSRNRTVLIGLVRDLHNPLATRFEMRSPSPHSNTYLLVGSAYMLMLDGIRHALQNRRTPDELAAAISKKAGVPDSYLETDREYRSEENVFEYYTEEERARLFGRAPATVWENFRAFEEHAGELEKITAGEETEQMIIRSYREQMISKWSTEFHDRLIPNSMDFVRRCVKAHSEESAADYDIMNWRRVNELRLSLGKDYIGRKSLLTLAKEALDEKDYDRASDLELQIQEQMEELRDAYNTYRKNLF
ncbi:MAG: glutamine synthetase [Mogibacterium sp.]|nr:glutamine synthetase [Mogibacterium sp.]